jgi:hypothetical protein
MKTKTKLFDKIRNQVKPILTNEDLGFDSSFLTLKIWHPSVLPQESSLSIFDSQTVVDYLSDLVIEKNKELDEIREAEKLDKKNLELRKAKVREITELNNQISEQINTYVEALGKLKPGELKSILQDFYKKINKWAAENPDTEQANNFLEFLDYPQDKFASDIFAEINEALTEYNQSKLEIPGNASTSEKK